MFRKCQIIDDKKIIEDVRIAYESRSIPMEVTGNGENEMVVFVSVGKL